MESLGEYLKRVREEKEVTLEEVARVTRIRRDFLSALERDDYQLFPAPVYMRGFLKTYAGFLGLNVNEALARLSSQLAARVTEEVGKSSVVPSGSSQWPVPLVFLLIVALAALGFYYFPGRQGYRGALKKPVPATPSVTVSPGAGMASMPEPAPEIYTQESKHELVMRASAPALVTVRADNQAPQQIALKAGETVMLSARENFELTVENAAAVEITFDRKPLGALGSEGEKVELTLPRSSP